MPTHISMSATVKTDVLRLVMQNAADSTLWAALPGQSFQSAVRVQTSSTALSVDLALHKEGLLLFTLPDALAGAPAVALWFQYGNNGYSVLPLGVSIV